MRTFREQAGYTLSQIYLEASRIPSLSWQGLIPVKLDATLDQSEIPSELRIRQLSPLRVDIGRVAMRERFQTLAKGNSLQGRFHHSSKRYLGKELNFPITFDGQNKTLNTYDLIQAAWRELRFLTEEDRNRNKSKYSEGNFDRVVLTYPTVAPPTIRRELKKLMVDLGFRRYTAFLR